MAPEEDRLLFLINYALGAPDWNACKLILLDAVHGATGANDCQQIRETETYKAAAKAHGVTL